MIAFDAIRPNTVTVLIGPNGSGKSRLLRKLCISFLKRNENVIAVAPTIYDRFKRMPKRGLRFFGARQGTAAAPNVIRSILALASSENPQLLKNLNTALRYTNFDPIIGIELRDLKLENFPEAAKYLSRHESEELYSALLKWQSRPEKPEVVQLRLDTFSFEELDSLTFAILARHDELLHRTKTASRIRYLLYRKGEPITLLDACSGEINFITTVGFISTHINQGSVVAIDEPETSLHPTWQQSYVRTLLDLFHYYQPRILISTHSPIIISGAEASVNELVSVYEMQNGSVRAFDGAHLGLEEMYGRLFGLITPKNHYLSRRAVELLNALSSGDQPLDSVLGELKTLRKQSYDESQKEVIGKFEEIARKLEATNAGGS